MPRRVASLKLVAPCLFTMCLTWVGVAQTQTSSPPVEIKVTARQYQFEPKVITVQKGKPVRLLITSADVHHGFAIEAFGIDKHIEPYKITVVEFTPESAGRFPFSCSVFCGDGHEEMSGELVVTDDQSSSAGMQVKFDDQDPGVVVVEAGNERLRIDTRTKTVTRLEQAQTAAEKPQSTVKQAEIEAKPPAEPYDYRLVNVPTPKRVLAGSLNLYFTHRFTQPVRPLSDSDQDLFGFDSFAVSSFGLFYGVTDRLYINAYRSPICQPGLCKTIELGVGYHWLDERGRSPIALTTYASVEGDDNFKKDYTYNLQVMVARSVTRYVHLFFSPAVHFNANQGRRFDPRPNDFFPPEPLANQFAQDKHGGSFGFGISARVRPTISLLFEYTPRVGFKLGQVVPVFDSGSNRITGFRNQSEPALGFGIGKDIGRHTFTLTFSNTQTSTTSRYNSSNLLLPPSRFTVGFNLYRRFLK